MPNTTTTLIFSGLFLLFTTLDSNARERIALIIGNGDYNTVSTLPNPPNDAQILSKALQELDFTVTMANNLTQARMIETIRQFGQTLKFAGKDTIGFFYYAGHAVQLGGGNYLLPTDVNIATVQDLNSNSVHLELVMQQMTEAEIAVNFIIIDACRDNPFDQDVDLRAGLAQVRAPWRSIVAYSTEPGGVALDGEGQNSPYTAALVQEIMTPGVPAEQAFKRVRRRLLEATASQQISWESSSLTEDIFFVPDSGENYDKSLYVATRIKPKIAWEDLNWSDLTSDQRHHWMILGWTEQSWDGDQASPASERKIWDQLEQKEQVAATILGYTKPMWDGTDSQIEDRSLETQVETSVSEVDWDQFDWAEMSKKHRDLWSTLGWTSKKWSGNSPVPSSEQKDWSELSSKERKAATLLGFTRSKWDD